MPPREYNGHGELCCTAMVTSSIKGRQCRNAAMEGTEPPRCETHYANAACMKGEFSKNRYMPRYYLQTMRPLLAERITKCLEESKPFEALDLYEELALIRDQASLSVAAYAEAVETGNAEAQMATGLMMRDQLEHVIKAVESAAALEETKQKISGAFVHGMGAVLQAMLKACWEVFHDDVRVKDFEQVIRNQLIIEDAPGRQNLGTLITPDLDVVEMDNLVPRETESDAHGPEPIAE